MTCKADLNVIHSLEPDERTLHGHFSRELAPVLEIAPGDTVVFRTLDSGWGLEPYEGGAYRERRELEREADGHALTGPVAIRGARKGMTLRIDIGDVIPGAYGFCLAGGWPADFNERLGVVGDGITHAYELDAERMTGRSHLGHTIELKPFLGVMGMPPDEPGEHSTIPPRTCGGNLDCRELIKGATLYLPIPVDGALFSCGDGHAAQGDGEVSGTAIECPVERAELTFGLADLPLTTPIARDADGSWLTLGLGATLDDAAHNALEAMLDLLGREHGLARRDALAIASLHVDLRVTQMVNRTVGVHALLRAPCLH
jgi:acetamidase/formamidase